MYYNWKKRNSQWLRGAWQRRGKSSVIDIDTSSNGVVTIDRPGYKFLDNRSSYTPNEFKSC